MANLLGLAVHEGVVGARCAVKKLNAPIVLFTFNRPVHARRTLKSLAGNAEFLDSPLVIYSDGARNASEKEQVEETRRIIRDWPHPNKTLIERDCNWGLANSIIAGVTQLCEEYGRVIVLEDDMVTSPFFLAYMNAALVTYEEDDRVISIHGYSFPIDNLPEAFFIKGASCWGWATWKRGWDLFEPDGERLYAVLKEKKMMYRFNVNGVYPYRKMLKDQMLGKNNSWAIRWNASALINQKLTLHPGRSLVWNIGLDGTGHHCDQYDGFESPLTFQPIRLTNLSVVESAIALQAWSKYLRSVRIKKYLMTISSMKRLKNFVLHK